MAQGAQPEGPNAGSPQVTPQFTALLHSDAAQEPVCYTGGTQPDPAYYDGRLPHAVGVHHIQVFRARRSETAGDRGFTYNHQPYVVWWRNRFYFQFLGAPRNEHDAPTLTFLCTSADGYAWSAPQLAFPEYRLPAFELDGVAYASGMPAVMHQRMGFYVAPDGRLLMLGFYGICPDPEHSPNAGNGVGRVVREVRDDGTLGEIYFIRYNRHAGFDERNTRFPFYTASADVGFRTACEALLADPLATLQWWDEDRAGDGFYRIDPSAVAGAPAFHAHMVTSEGAGKAFTWFTRPDGVVVGLWKNRYGALSPDRGRTWTPIARSRSLRTTGAKIWGQRTSDGRCVLVYNHSATQANRFPISALVGDDGHTFPTLLCLGGEVPPRRYWGRHKGAGMHYFRGISEGGAQPPDGDLWVAYSMNKEDLWILRARVPLAATENTPPAADEITRAQALSDLRRWNLYLPRWAAARLVVDAQTGRRVLELFDEDPWDRSQAERVFPEAAKLRIGFRVQGRELAAPVAVEIDVQGGRHERPIRLRLTDGVLTCGTSPTLATTAFALRRWYRIELDCDCAEGRYALRVDGVTINAQVPFAEPAHAVTRIVFRTGSWRGAVPAHLVDGTAAKQEIIEGGDVPSDAPVPPVVFWIGELTTGRK